MESTRVKINHLFSTSTEYIQSLIQERAVCMDLVDKYNMNQEFPAEIKDRQQLSFSELTNRINQLEELEQLKTRLDKCNQDLAELSAMLAEELKSGAEDEMRAVVEQDIGALKLEIFELKIKILDALAPEDPEDRENVVLELSAGVGGLESRIFASDLFDMYKALCGEMSWSFDPVEVDYESNGLSEFVRKAVIEVTGREVYKLFKFESGVHRVQRVPKTESKGRVHTSTVGVVVTPKPAQVNIELNMKDLKIETKTSGGPGGQHANKTESAVRIVHLPTGIMVYCDQERHMMQNRSKALAYLKQKLYQREHEESLNKRQSNRRMQIGSSSRSERIRTYNYLQDRISDHRLDENFKGIQAFLTNGRDLRTMILNLKYEQTIELIHEQLETFKNAKSKPKN